MRSPRHAPFPLRSTLLRRFLSVAVCLLALISAAAGASAGGFAGRLLPAKQDGGFRQEGWWVWCPSVIRGDDGRWHLFGARWPTSVSFHPHWMTHSEVFRAVADRPEGPYTFVETVLPARGAAWGDGRATHNPRVHRSGNVWLLYYIGFTFPEDYTPENPLPHGSAAMDRIRGTQRIWLATAPSVLGPWTRQDRPILDVSAVGWDRYLVSNPAPHVLADGAVMLAYKGVGQPRGVMHYGMARAADWRGPYERLSTAPVIAEHIEDAFLWGRPGGYELIAKDMTGKLCGERAAAFHATSPDGLSWSISRPALAYSRTVRWDDGRSETLGNVERPFLLLDDRGEPTHLFAAATIDGRPWRDTSATRIIVWPVRRP